MDKAIKNVRTFNRVRRFVNAVKRSSLGMELGYHGTLQRGEHGYENQVFTLTVHGRSSEKQVASLNLFIEGLEAGWAQEANSQRAAEANAKEEVGA